MSFLQPMFLAALPLIALPIIIHLINQRRYQTIRWAAMMFLLAANKMSRGYARLRQWLIMAFRMAAIAGLTFAVARPLAGGWLGLSAGGRPDTTIILLDRSPSMQETSGGAGGSKLETARQQLVQTLKTVGSARWVVIESATNTPHELESIDTLLNAPSAEPASASSDIPGMLQAAHDYIQANKTGRTEVWIASDLRENDWNSESGRWQTLRDAFLEFRQAVRFHLLAYPKPAPTNLEVRVTCVRRRQAGDEAELLVSLRLEREGGGDAKVSVPVQFEIQGARSVVTVEMAGPHYELKDHRIPLEKSHTHGWGKVSIPADANPADNAYWFAFDKPAPRHTLIVSDDPQTARALELSSTISPDPTLTCTAEVVPPDHLDSVDWADLGLILWQAPLPGERWTKELQGFVEGGGYLMFFPTRSAGEGEFLGTHWASWSDEKQDIPVENWRGDQDLLAHTQSGTALPVGQLQIHRYCKLAGEFTPLGSLRGGAPLLARVATNAGGVYFCTTTPALGDSTLASNGIVLYVLVQRALAAGAARRESTRQVVAGEVPSGEKPSQWIRLAADGTTGDPALQSGVYQSSGRLLAVNRAAAEDSAAVVADRKVAGVFRGLDFIRVDDQAGNFASLIQEIWRVFLVAMMTALVVEAALCLPHRTRAVVRAAS